MIKSQSLLITFIIIVLIIVCIKLLMKNTKKQSTEPKQENINIELLINDLEKMGFYKYTEPKLIEENKQESIRTGYPFGEETGRQYSADSEDLSEGGVGEFLNEIKSFLDRQKVHFTINNEDFAEQYEIEVNNEKVILYTNEELENEDYADLTTRRAFAIISELLEKAGSHERIYALYDWNDQLAIFLTNEMFERINGDHEIEDREKPRVIVK